MNIKHYIVGLLLALFYSATAFADTFVVRHVKVIGADRAGASAVLNYVPIKVGQTFSETRGDALVKALHKTSMFESVLLEREGDTLIIKVVERPTIGSLTITGNSVITTDKLKEVMRSLDIAEGRIYDKAMIEKIRQSLLNQYYQLGRYNATVTVDAKKLPSNRVAVTLTISEGLVATVKRINIIGNHDISESVLLKQFDLTTSGLLTSFTQTDNFSEDKMEGLLEKLRAYYMDRGYVRFQVKSSQAQVTPDKKSVYITVVIHEGSVYRLSDYEVTGTLLLPKADYLKVIKLDKNEPFSRKKIIAAQKAIATLLGDKGYVFANISILPHVDDQTHTVRLDFNIKPGKRAYVRTVRFLENTRTNDVVLRREVLQMEAAPASVTKIEKTKHRLSLLPYIKQVEVAVNPVAGSDDLVDVNYQVKEDSTTQATFKIGYQQLFGLVLGLGFTQKNILGTGNTLGVNLTRSGYEQSLAFDFSDPYYTDSGMSRSFHASITRTDPSHTRSNNFVSAYTANDYALGVMYGVPIGQDEDILNRLQFGVSYQNILIHTVSPKKVDRTSAQVQDFTRTHGRHFQEADFKLAYTRDARDRAIFPTSGSNQAFVVDAYLPLQASALSFYTLSYNFKYYYPLVASNAFIATARLDLGYGNGFHGIGDFPYFKYYYAGGINSVRGYADYNLGPKDTIGNAFGGNKLAVASIGLIFPNYISDNLRTSTFFDAGNVYLGYNNKHKYGKQSTNAGPIRYAVGVGAEWLIPGLGPIRLSLAKPINLGKNDTHSEPFQFALGAEL